MAVHDVKFTLPERDLGKADIEISIKKDGGKFGKLKISKGSLVWVPLNKVYGYKIGWTAFADLATQHGDKEG